MIRRARGLVILLLVLAALLVADWASGWAPRRAVETGLLGWDLVADGGAGPWSLVTAAPIHEAVSLAAVHGSIAADLYRPASGAKAGLVLLPGLAPEGREHPRLIALAESLARARFAVLVPEIAGWRDLRLAPDDPVLIRAALDYLAQRPTLAPEGRFGIAALSYGAGPALIAVLEAPTEARPAFLVALGGLYDLRAALTLVTTGQVRGVDGRWRAAPANPFGTWLFVRNNADALESSADGMLLEAIAERRIVAPAAPIDDLRAALGAGGLAALALAENTDPERVDRLIEALPGALRARFDRLDPAAHGLAGLRTRLILIHGLDDPILPPEQSLALAAAAPEGVARFYPVEGLNHVDPDARLDTGALWSALYRLLVERDGGT